MADTIIYPTVLEIQTYISPYYIVKSGGIPDFRTLSSMPTQWIRKCGGQDYSNERQLYRIAVTEAYNKFGVCMTYYIVSFDINYDKIYGEDNDRRFIRKFDVMAYYPLNTEEKMWTRFAIEGIDNFSVFISKDHFREACTYGQQLVPGNIGKDTYSTYVPKTGDVIRSQYNDYLYEIITVKEESMMIHLNKRYVWELIIHPFRDNHTILSQDTSASMEEIDDYTDKKNEIFNIDNEITSADNDAKYDQEPNEKPTRDLFGGF
jgi:hypothetical protein